VSAENLADISWAAAAVDDGGDSQAIVIHFTIDAVQFSLRCQIGCGGYRSDPISISWTCPQWAVLEVD
jgi:hypothetical protein